MSLTTQKITADIAAALKIGDRRGFVRLVVKLIDARPSMTSGWKSLSIPLFDFGELDLARRVMDRYAAAMNTPIAQFERALLYVRTAEPAGAIRILDTIGRSIPDPASNYYLRGTIALNLGNNDAAREFLLKAYAARPAAGQILQTLSMLGSLEHDFEIANLIVQAERVVLANAEHEHGSYYYALGKVWDDQGDTERAFEAFARGAAIIARERPYDAKVDASNAEAATAGWTTERIITASARIAIPTSRAIFVTGLPRSGTTLLEQILTSHTMVTDGDELGRFPIVANEIGGASYSSFEKWGQSNAFAAATNAYLHLANQRFGRTNRFVDKTLEASRYLGLIAALLPEAPIFWMRRNPYDNAWSCFSTFFLTGLGWSWSLEAIAEHMALENRLLERWQEILGDRLQIVDYEQLVTAKDVQIPKLVRHAGLSMEAATLTPEGNTRLVTTASVSQVRAPINTRAVGRANRYATHLQPFVERYEKLIHAT